MKQEFKKTDLLKFQKSLNDQFMSIFEEKSHSVDLSNSNDVLGLLISYQEFNLFISLNDLQNISTNLRFENTIRTSSWLLGFNHEHGNLYTIINLTKLFDYLITGKKDFELPSLHVNSNIIYLKKTSDEFYGLLINEFKLDYTAEFTKIFELDLNQNANQKKRFLLSEGISFDDFIKKENMSKGEWDTLLDIYQNKFQQIDSILTSKGKTNNILPSMINNVYLDGFGKRPVFVLDIDSLLLVLSKVSPL